MCTPMHHIPFLQAGLLTFGSSSSPRLPGELWSGIFIHSLSNPSSDIIAAVVPDYSDGLVPDSNGIPCWANGT